jgi:hypothetical protein
VCLSSRLAFGDFPVQIRPGCWPVMSLCQDDEVKNMVEASIATAIEPMVYLPCRGCLEGCGTGVGR